MGELTIGRELNKLETKATICSPGPQTGSTPKNPEGHVPRPKHQKLEGHLCVSTTIIQSSLCLMFHKIIINTNYPKPIQQHKRVATHIECDANYKVKSHGCHAIVVSL